MQMMNNDFRYMKYWPAPSFLTIKQFQFQQLYKQFLLTRKASCEWFNHKYLHSFYLKGVRASTLPMTRVSYRVLKERRWAYLSFAHMKRKILALRSMYLMQPQADIDEIELETMIQMLLYLLFQWLALFQEINSGSPVDLERMYRISLHLP